ncbi:MAG: type IIP restriction/modification system, restriction endonuclease [Candidatus Campylobacter infans]|nr:MAG: type IIP restriction/modification system, restriction endonuclease [Candidatus Campylobacter infans]
MKNKICFNEFLKSLKTSNRDLKFYVAWDKCLKNKDEISISLNHLNFLLGKDKSELKENINKLFKSYPKAFECLNILIATRDVKDIVFNELGKECELKSYFTNSNKIYDFICQSGLVEIFADRKIKDLNDFVFGVEVGLDSNARKNRSGKAMERTLANIFQQAKLNYKEQVSIDDFINLKQTFGTDIKKFDFVICNPTKTYFVECNFYTSGGSKLNETARSYEELALRFDKCSGAGFIWITDGKGWLKAKNKLEQAYKSIEIYNLSNIENFILKVKNEA